MRAVTLSLAVATGLALAAATAPAMAADHPYVGTNTCKKCHIKEWRSWSETKMAMAFDILKPGERADAKKKAGLDPDKDFTKDASCLGCHTTGYGKEGGFVDIESTPHQAGVGCEMCHGAGGTYTQDQYMSLKNKEYKKAEVVAAGLVDTVGEAQCVTCHNDKNPLAGEGYTFDFETKKKEGVHENFPLKYSH